MEGNAAAAGKYSHNIFIHRRAASTRWNGTSARRGTCSRGRVLGRVEVRRGRVYLKGVAARTTSPRPTSNPPLFRCAPGKG